MIHRCRRCHRFRRSAAPVRRLFPRLRYHPVHRSHRYRRATALATASADACRTRRTRAAAIPADVRFRRLVPPVPPVLVTPPLPPAALPPLPSPPVPAAAPPPVPAAPPMPDPAVAPPPFLRSRPRRRSAAADRSERARERHCGHGAAISKQTFHGGHSTPGSGVAALDRDGSHGSPGRGGSRCAAVTCRLDGTRRSIDRDVALAGVGDPGGVDRRAAVVRLLARAGAPGARARAAAGPARDDVQRELRHRRATARRWRRSNPDRPTSSSCRRSTSPGDVAARDVRRRVSARGRSTRAAARAASA